MSGYRLRPEYARFDAELRFDVGDIATNEHPACIAGAILTGEKTPLDCTAYGTLCSAAEAARARRWSAPRAPAPRSSPPAAGSNAAGGFSQRAAARPGGARERPGGTPDDRPGAAARRRIDADGVSCPAPIPEDQRVILGHGSGGQLSNALMREVLAPALAAASPGGVLNDAAIVDVAGLAPRVHDGLVRRVAHPVPGRGHRRARGQRDAQRPRDDGRDPRRDQPRLRHRGGAAARGAAARHGVGGGRGGQGRARAS